MPAYHPVSPNTFVPTHEASGKLVVDFSRNPKDFAIAEYAQIVPAKNTTGYYLEMTLEEAGRVMNTDGADFAWPDGAKAPENYATESFQFKEFRCERYQDGFSLGDLTTEQATWDIVARHGAMTAQKMMTLRTQLAITVLTTTGNYAASHTSAVTSISGVTGNWAASTTARQDIKRSLNHAADTIRKDTFGVVKPRDLKLVISPGLAKELSVSQEIVDYIKQSPDAWAYVKGDLANQNRNSAYGLPPFLYDYELCVEDAVKTTTQKGATTSKSYVLADATPILVARPGGLEGVEGAPSFSTLTLFMYEEMTVETRHEPDNRRTVGRVVENYDPVLTAPVSGFLFTGAV